MARHCRRGGVFYPASADEKADKIEKAWKEARALKMKADLYRVAHGD